MGYIKQLWTDTVSVLSAARFNHIESGIETAEKIISLPVNIGAGVSRGDCIKLGTNGIWQKDQTGTRAYDGDGNVVKLGVVGGFSGLERGYTYYFQSDGSIGLGVTNYKAGEGISTTEIDFRVGGDDNPFAYTDNLDKFYATPGSSGEMRLKIIFNLTMDGATIHRATTAYDGTGLAWGVEIVDITDDTDTKGNNGWYTDDNGGASDLTNGDTYYYKAFPYVGTINNTTDGDNETEANAGGLVHEYPFDEVSGSTAIDTAGSNNLSTGNCTFIEGEVGDQVDVSTSGYLDSGVNLVGSLASFDFTFTFDDEGVVFAQAESVSSGVAGWRVICTTTEFSVNEKNGASGTQSTIIFGVSLTLGETYHVHVRRLSNNVWDLWIDNVSIAATSDNLNIEVNNKHFTLAATQSSSYGRGTSGENKIDQFRVYNRALSAEERTNLYNGGAGC